MAKTPLSTEARRFVRLALEAVDDAEVRGAALLSNYARQPDTDWRAAMRHFWDDLERATPTRRRAMLAGVARRLPPKMGVLASCHRIGSQTVLNLETASVELHPFDGVGERGICAFHHNMVAGRRPQDLNLSAFRPHYYLSEHAIGRAFERSGSIQSEDISRRYHGALSMVTRLAVWNIARFQQSLLYIPCDDVVFVGAMRGASLSTDKGSVVANAFLDIRTALAHDMLSDTQLAQANAIAKALNTIAYSDESPDAEAIPFIPRDEDDFVLRAAKAKPPKPLTEPT